MLDGRFENAEACSGCLDRNASILTFLQAHAFRQANMMRDQMLLCRKVGGFMEAHLMEDVDLVKKLCQACGPPAIVQQPMVVSPRRWERLGYTRATLTNLAMMCAYKLGADPNFLAGWYHR